MGGYKERFLRSVVGVNCASRFLGDISFDVSWGSLGGFLGFWGSQGVPEPRAQRINAHKLQNNDDGHDSYDDDDDDDDDEDNDDDDDNADYDERTEMCIRIRGISN